MRNGWKKEQLGGLCDILDSQRKPITKRNRTTGRYPYYGATGIVDYVNDFIFDEPLVLVGEDGAKWESGENTAFRVEGKCWGCRRGVGRNLGWRSLRGDQPRIIRR